MIDKLLQTPNMTDYIIKYIEKIPNFAKIFRNISLDYYKAIYNVIPNYYNFIINVSNECPLYSDDFIEDKFGELSGYAIIDGLNYLDPVCKNGVCPNKIDIKSLIVENSNRRLSENNFTKIVKEIVNILGEMKDFIKNNHYIPEDNESLSLRKLGGLKTDVIYSTTSSFNIASNIKYSPSQPGLDQKNVEAALSPLRTTYDSYNNFIYKYATKFGEDVENKYKDDLASLDNIIKKMLNNLKIQIKSDDYQLISNYLGNSYSSIEYYLTNITGSMSEISEFYLDYINNIYVDNQMEGIMITNKILDYYKGLVNLITEKSKAIGEKEYKSHYSNQIPNINAQIKSIEEGLGIINKNENDVKNFIKVEKTLHFGEIKENKSLPDIMKESFDYYEWDKKDNYDEKLDDKDKSGNYMYKSKAEKKEEDTKKESKKKEKKSEFDKKCEKLQKKMEELHIASESEITFSFKERKFALSTKVGWEYEKSVKFGWQFPFTFPSVPCIQVRIGIKIQLGFTIGIGIQIDIKYENNKPDFVISFYVTFTISLRLSITAEAGAFTGVVSAYAGIEWTYYSFNDYVLLYQT